LDQANRCIASSSTQSQSAAVEEFPLLFLAIAMATGTVGRRRGKGRGRTGSTGGKVAKKSGVRGGESGAGKGGAKQRNGDRGGRGKGGHGRDKRKVTKEDLDKELDNYLMQDEEGCKRVTDFKRAKLDTELEAYMAAQAGAMHLKNVLTRILLFYGCGCAICVDLFCL
jgi:hypothetical protein